MIREFCATVFAALVIACPAWLVQGYWLQLAGWLPRLKGRKS